jgi:hypothetical protein
MGPGQIMGGGSGTTRSKSAAASHVSVGGNTTDDRKIPAMTSGVLLLAVGALFLFDRAKFKMVVGVS